MKVVNLHISWQKNSLRMTREEAIREMNTMGRQGASFVFVISYDMTDCMVWTMDNVPQNVLFNFRGVSNEGHEERKSEGLGALVWDVKAESEDYYKKRFGIVRKHLLRGDSYLVNLTARMPVETNLSLRDIYNYSKAKYKLWVKDKMVCFSPETFLQIRGGIISCCPMKGTIRADAPNAREKLLADPKEIAEHATIVDLIRNDLSIIANQVSVEDYRYVERLHTNNGDIYQTSSRVAGQLPKGFESRLGEIIFSQLPAGSVTGAPKPMTCRIIREAEDYERGFYTGVMGYWRNGVLDSAVMIRFIDTDGTHLWFKAGGGVTAKSDCHREYLETLEKIYVPVTID